MKIEDKAYFAMEPNLQGMKKVRDEIYALAQTHLRLSEKSTDSMKKYSESATAQALSSFVNRAPYAAEIGMEFKGSAYWNKKAMQLAKEGAAYGVIADKLIAEALSIYNSHSKPVEDKAYFDGGYFRTAATPLSLLTKDLRETLRRFAAIVNCPIKGFGNLTTQNEFTSKINQLKTWIAADIAKMENDKLKETFPAMAIHRHHWIKDRKEVIAELKKIEDTKISLLPTVAKNAKPVEDKRYFDRQGTKAKFYLDPSNIPLILKQEENENRKVLQLVKQKQASGKKSDLMDATNLAHGMAYSNATANTIQDLRKISKSKNPADKQAAQQALSKIEAIESFWHGKHSELQSQYRSAHSRRGFKAKFAYVSPKYEREDSWLAKITDKAERAYTTISQLRERLSSLQNMLQRTPPGTARTELEAYYKTQIQAMLNAKKEYEQAIKHSRTGTKSKFAENAPIGEAAFSFIKSQIAAGKTIAITTATRSTRISPKTYAKWEQMTTPLFKVSSKGDLQMYEKGQYAKITQGALALSKISSFNRTGTKTKFANRGAFAEASSSPVLGSLLEKKVMPEGGWRAVETDGAALVIAFEDGDIAGNFARRASENGYSATAPMAMAGRFWNVKVQNENKQ